MTFKVGDRVKRVFGPNYGGVYFGGIYTVSAIDNYRGMYIREADPRRVYAQEYFILAEKDDVPKTGFGKFVREHKL